jgi:hypothetical protein
MKLTSGMREQLVQEIRFAVDGIRKSPKSADKIYYYSAVYAVIDRVYNFEYDPELVFIYQVVRQSFDLINAKISLSTQRDVGLATAIPINLFDKLCSCLDELATRIEKDQKTYAILQDIANIGYSTTGNGLYLYTKGMLKI